jgi:cytosine/uracil/thiamine/allantoin permease
MNDKKEKQFIFPENISSDYGVFLGLSLKELAVYVLPVFVICLVFLFLPPHSLKWIFIKLAVSIFLLTILLAVLTSKPVKTRHNIRLTDYLKMKSSYNKRQHKFFIAKRKDVHGKGGMF